MHVLIIGGTRFVGYLATWRLLARGDRVTLLNRGTLPDPFGDRVERLRVDRQTSDFAAALRGRRFDATIDFAAYTGGDVRDVIDTLGDGAGHYVFVSTGQVYLVRVDVHRPSRELDYPGPVLPRPTIDSDIADWDYGIGKRAAEDLLDEAWRTRRFRATRLRIPKVIGERDHYRRIESYLWRLLDGGPVIVPDGGGQPVRPVYGGDVARVCAEILGDEDAYGQAYNLAQRETPTLLATIAELRELCGSHAPLVPVASEDLAEHALRAAEISPLSGKWTSFLDPTRAEAELGFTATPLHEQLASCVASFLAHPPPEPPDNYRHRDVERTVAKH
jgi:nucleoside-diphosphate-sugar epimerase